MHTLKQCVDRRMDRAHLPGNDPDSEPERNEGQAYSIFRNWIWEILSIAVATGLIAAIAAVLATYDGNPAPDWGEHINLNALLATLSTILRAMLVVVVSQIISQRKWEWLTAKQLRALSDLQIFDSGSRGIIGAVQFITTVFWRDPVSFMAAIVLLASFLVGPFVQQASRTSECTFVAPGLKASLPYAHYIPRRSGYVTDVERDDLGVPAPDLITAVLSAVTEPQSTENQIRGSCPTGNCTFQAGDPVSNDKDAITHSSVAMCSKCIDITPLVVRENETCGAPVLSLPRNISLSRACGDREVVRIQPSPDLEWMGKLLTPELRSASRWAYVNATFAGLNSYANETVAAAMCSLYPCVQTYTASMEDNKVLETKLASKVMQLDLLWNDQVEEKGEHNALENVYQSYTTVQSPCQVQGRIFDLSRSTSTQSNGTALALHDFTDYGKSEALPPTSINATAPKECIYRQHPQFVVAMSRLLNNEVFNGSCSSAKTFSCRAVGRSESDDHFLPGLASETVLRTLYGESHKSPSNLTAGYSNITEWFDHFADAMTRRYRMDYGSFDEGDRNGDELPLDEVHGVVWQTTICVSMRPAWLALPITLTVITVILATWTIALNWKHRRSRPVWKDSILPLMFYGPNMVNGALDEYSRVSSTQAIHDGGADRSDGNRDPLEVDSMMEIAKGVVVLVPWQEKHGNSEETPDSVQKTKWCWRSKNNDKDVSNGHGLDADEGTTTRPGDNEGEGYHREAEQTDDRASAVPRMDGYVQSLEAAELERHGVESPENLEAQDHLINDHQTQVSEHVGASDDENERRAMDFERDRRTLEVDVHG